MEQLTCDVLVIGGGAAGTRAALEAKNAVPGSAVLVVVDTLYDAGGSTNMVASEALGINAPFNFEGDGDNPDIFEADIIATGGGLADASLCRIVAEEAGPRIRELMDAGLKFSAVNGRVRQQKLSGCTKARSLTCGGSTGREIVRALKTAFLGKGGKILEKTKIFRLYQNENGAVQGAYGVRDGKALFIAAGAVVLATGGAGAMFSTNVTPETQSGDGWAMAYDAGCSFTNMEFFQCGPAVMRPGMKFIIHSHMWRFLPKLSNKAGYYFLPDYCPPGVSDKRALDLKAMSYPFSVRTDAKYVDIAVFKEIMAGRGLANGGVNFDVTHIPKAEFLEKAPITYATLLKAGIDLTAQPLELGIAVQNFNGGVLIDGDGWTGVEGLYAAGEVTGGVHGSDRPGGNNLTDTQVFGYRAGRAAARFAAGRDPSLKAPGLETGNLLAAKDEIRRIKESESLYYKEMTVVRSASGLQEVFDFIDENERSAVSAQFKNRLLTGRLLATAMAARKESRGTHYREDYPESDESWRKRLALRKGRDGLPEMVEAQVYNKEN